MYDHTVEKLVIKITNQAEHQDVISYSISPPCASNGVKTTKLFAEAHDYAEVSVTDMVTHMEYLEAHLSKGYSFELCELKVVTTMKTVDTRDEAFVEERRRRALAKLSIKDIEALGLKNLAVYNKVRYHGSEAQ